MNEDIVKSISLLVKDNKVSEDFIYALSNGIHPSFLSYSSTNENEKMILKQYDCTFIVREDLVDKVLIFADKNYFNDKGRTLFTFNEYVEKFPEIKPELLAKVFKYFELKRLWNDNSVPEKKLLGLFKKRRSNFRDKRIRFLGKL